LKKPTPRPSNEPVAKQTGGNDLGKALFTAIHSRRNFLRNTKDDSSN